MLLRTKGEKSFLEFSKQKLKDFITTKLALKEKLKGLLKAEKKGHKIVTKYMKVHISLAKEKYLKGINYL